MAKRWNNIDRYMHTWVCVCATLNCASRRSHAHLHTYNNTQARTCHRRHKCLPPPLPLQHCSEKQSIWSARITVVMCVCIGRNLLGTYLPPYKVFAPHTYVLFNLLRQVDIAALQQHWLLQFFSSSSSTIFANWWLPASESSYCILSCYTRWWKFNGKFCVNFQWKKQSLNEDVHKGTKVLLTGSNNSAAQCEGRWRKRSWCVAQATIAKKDITDTKYW